MLPVKEEIKKLCYRCLAAYAFRSGLRFRALLCIDDKSSDGLQLFQRFDSSLNYLLSISLDRSVEYLYPSLRYLQDDLKLFEESKALLLDRNLLLIAYNCLFKSVYYAGYIDKIIKVTKRVENLKNSNPSLQRQEEGAFELLENLYNDLTFFPNYWNFQTIPELRNICLGLRNDYSNLIEFSNSSTSAIGETIDPTNEGPLGSIWTDYRLKAESEFYAEEVNSWRKWPNRRPRAFLSYASEDHRVAMNLRRNLREQGIEIWFDKYDLLPGQKWVDVIRRSINECDFFIALISDNSVSKRGQMQRELKEAAFVLEEFPDDDVFIIPVVIGDCNIPESLKDLHAINLSDDEKGYVRIAESMLRSVEQRH